MGARQGTVGELSQRPEGPITRQSHHDLMRHERAFPVDSTACSEKEAAIFT